MNVLSLFDGLSCGQIALKESGIKVNKYFASEIDPYTIKVAKENFPDTIHLGNVKNVDALGVENIDLLIGGSPCQGFSYASSGKELNFKDPRSKLFFEYVRLKNELNPKWFFLENVSMKQECLDIISEYLGVKPTMINSDRFVQQNRKRYYWTNIPIAELPDRPDWQGNFYRYRNRKWRHIKTGVTPCLTAHMGTGGNNVPCKSMNLSDKLTTEECEILQGIPSGYTSTVSSSQRYKMIGNSWTVPVIKFIMEGMK
jgi:site-specific DNA-cytosine methylase